MSFSSYMMRSSVTFFFFFFFLLFAGLYFFSGDIGFSVHLGSSASLSSSVLNQESRPQRVVNSLFHNRKLKYHESKFVDGAMNQSNLLKTEFSRRGVDNSGDPVFHTDYHGVTTHPTPTPKHPTP